MARNGVTLVTLLLLHVALGVAGYPAPPPTTPPAPRPTPHPVPDRDERRIDRDNATRVRPGFVECPCSMTGRGFDRGSVLPNGTAALLRLNRAARSPSTARAARALYDECAAAHGHEACVNWDAASVFDGAVSLCASDRVTNRNVVSDGPGRLRTVGPCDARDATASLPRSLRGGARLLLRAANATALDGILAPLEGCVAVEHLAAQPLLQHPLHLRRPVLCHRGFCATPNHAIIVDGAWTSMRRMCAGPWACTADVRLVNNLSVFVRTRLHVGNGVVVTPYDVRIPIPLTWLLQAVELATVLVSPLALLGATRRTTHSLMRN